jgi:diadenosine tetraphosphate (Ap4A) HIT family hydrolase
MPEIMPCITCELVARRDDGTAPLWDCIQRTQFWDIVHCNAATIPGWLVVVARRHIEAIDELTRDEALELGVLLQQVSLALKQVIKCTKTYVVQFAEAEGHHHVHFHVIPRMANLPEERRGTKIFEYLGVSEDERVSEKRMNEIAVKIQRILLSAPDLIEWEEKSF